MIIAEGQRNVASTGRSTSELGPHDGHHQDGRREGVQEPRPARLGERQRRTSRTRWKASSTRPRYGVAKGMKPEAVLKADGRRRPTRSTTKLRPGGEGARRSKLEDPLQVITVASLVQAEGKTHDDFRKMAEVVYNRLKPDNTRPTGCSSSTRPSTTCKDESKIDIEPSRDLRQSTTRTTRTTTRACRPGRSATPVRTRSRPRSTRPTAAGTTSSRSTAGQANSPRPTPSTRSSSTSSTHSRTLGATDAHPPGRRTRLAHRPLPLPGAAPRRVRGAGAHRLDVRPLRGRRGGAARVLRGGSAPSGRGCR